MFHLLHRRLCRKIPHSKAPIHSHRHFMEHLTCNFKIFISTTTAEQQQQELASFLQDSCRISSHSAVAIAKKLKLKTLEKPRSVVSLLKEFSFTDADIAALITRRPHILTFRSDLKSKLEFYQKIGLKPKTISANCVILYSKVQRMAQPNFELLKSFVVDEEKLVKLLNRAPGILTFKLEKLLIPRIRALQDYNVPMPIIETMLAIYPRAFLTRFGKFEQAFKEVVEMDVSFESLRFAHALGVFAQFPKSFRDRRMEIFRELGWSMDQVVVAMVRHPQCMGLKEEKMRGHSLFFKEKFDWGPKHLSLYPVLLSLSLEKRIKLRYEIWQILVLKGLLKKPTPSDPNYFLLSKKNFLEKYVFKYQEKAPQVLDVLRSYNMGLKE